MRNKVKILCTIMAFVLVMCSVGAASVLNSTVTWDVTVGNDLYHHNGQSHLASDFLSGNASTGATESVFGRYVEAVFTYYDSSTNKTYTTTKTQSYPAHVTMNCQVSFTVPSTLPYAKITKIDSTHITYYNNNPYPTQHTHCVW